MKPTYLIATIKEKNDNQILKEISFLNDDHDILDTEHYKEEIKDEERDDVVLKKAKIRFPDLKEIKFDEDLPKTDPSELFGYKLEFKY